MECIALAWKLESAAQWSAEKAKIAHQWEAAMEQSFALQSQLEDMMAISYAAAD
jgi:hypothetical protein